MKNAAEIAKKQFWMPKIPGEMIVHGYWIKGQCLPFALSKKASEVKCGVCGNTEGYAVNMIGIPGYNYDMTKGVRKSWSCMNSQCIQDNASGSKKEPYSIEKLSMQRCDVPDEFCSSDIEQLNGEQLKFISQIKEFCLKFHGYLLISGTPGIGKTFIATACMQEFLKKDDDCKFINSSELYIKWLEAKKIFGDTDLLDKYSKCKLLILDDLGVIAPKDGFLEFLYILLNRRISSSNLGTIITSNLDSKSMSEKLGFPIVSRVSSGLIIKYIDKDRRIHKF
jgi:DNA replication protein DnaC